MKNGKSALKLKANRLILAAIPDDLLNVCIIRWGESEKERSLTSHLTQYGSFQIWSIRPITRQLLAELNQTTNQ